MTAGRGFIALAALIFGNWRPVGAFAAALLFGFSRRSATRSRRSSGGNAFLVFNLPYVFTLIALVGVIGRRPAGGRRPAVRQAMSERS